ncbi:hypothetical protein PHJA_001385200 [Phtheirospermum japonicum]|uniref:Uncharacterized protein n=1 Tax=Phtheirospermum japonicum TaxID=374723 RepID=A0A830BY64_9LAMI|nr:hypothetical protein PHJA_001385200 [Phtheirospermum japonicum]
MFRYLKFNCVINNKNSCSFIKYGGKWICRLCVETVKDEILRSQKLISPGEAMSRHFSFCSKFWAFCQPQDPTVHLIRP